MSIAQRMKKHRKDLRTLADIADSKVFLALTEDGKNIAVHTIPAGGVGGTLHVLHAWNTPKPPDGTPVLGVSRRALLQDIAAQLVDTDLDFICLHDVKADQTRIPFTSLGCIYTGESDRLARARKKDRNYILIDACRDMLMWDVNPAETRLLTLTAESDLLDTVGIQTMPDFDLDVVEICTSMSTDGDAKFIACTSRLGSSPFSLATPRFAGYDSHHQLTQVQPALQFILESNPDFVLVDGGILPLSRKGAEIADEEIRYTEGTKTWVDKVNEVGEFNVRLQGLRALASLFGVETEITVLDPATQDSGTALPDTGSNPVPSNQD